jgi:hypothetical protein
MKYNYIELCRSYARSRYINIIKMTICVVTNSIIKYNVLLIFMYQRYSYTLQHYNKDGG